MKESLELLPVRRKPNSHNVQIGRVCSLHTNLYEVSLKQSPVLEQYVIDTQPAIDDEAVSLIRRLLSSKRQQLQDQIGLLTFKGKTMWGSKKAQKPICFEVGKNEALQILQNYQVVIKHTKSYAYSDILTLSLKEKRQILQVYTVALKEKFYKMGMRETTRSRFLRRQQGIDIKGYKILMCYDLKLVPLNKKLNLLVDVGFRVLSNFNALEQLNNFKSKEEKEAFAVGRPVVTTYNNRAYKVEKIRFDLNPFSTFNQESKQKEITFAQYMKQYHKITIITKNQPLFEVAISYKNQIVKGKQERVEKKGWLIPQLCRFSALFADIKENDFNSFKTISKQIKINPEARKKEEIKMISEINNTPGTIRVSTSCTEVKGIVYDQVEVLAKQRVFVQNGAIKIKEVREPMKLGVDDWLFVYSNLNPNSKGKLSEDDTFADQVIDHLQNAGKYFGIMAKDPYVLDVKQKGVQNWIKSIEDELKSNSKLREKVKIIVLMFSPAEKGYYSELKKYITNGLGLPCQGILKKTMRSKNSFIICGKILLQMNAKIDLPLWTVPMKHPYWKKKTIMYGGLSVSKNLKQQKWKGISPQQSKLIDGDNENNYAVGFVGTFTGDLSKVYSNVSMAKDLEELSKVKLFEDLMIDWIKYFFINQKVMPDIIMLYREGLTQKQVQIQGKAEVEALQKIVARARDKVGSYNPQIVYIMVVKKSSKRVYRPTPNQAQGKFAPPVMNNPVPGTMIFEPISSNNVFDFHLAAQYVTEGTSTLTQYQIAYDASQIPEEAIAQFTLQQCHNYPNWPGSISVPSCLQSADKLSRLIGEHIHQKISKESSRPSVQLRPFFL